MRKRVWIGVLVGAALLFTLVLFSTRHVVASSGDLVIYQVQPEGAVAVGSATAARQELAIIYNNSSQPVDVTNWCLSYSSSSDATKTQLGCLAPPNSGTRIWLDGTSYFRLATSDFVVAHPGFSPDVVFSSAMAQTSGHVRLLNGTGGEVDRLGWGTASQPETAATPTALTTKLHQRKAVSSGSSMLQDTDNNAVDFSAEVLSSLPASGLYEEFTPTDVCPNLSGLQTTMPPGYLADADGNCQLDVCANLDGLQVSVPSGYQSSDGENCNLIPLENAQLLITELLPNATSTDTGNEFIEIYNPNNRPINLSGYKLQLGPDFTETYVLPDQIMAAGTYLAFSDTQTGLTLPNSTAILRLVAPSGDVVSLTASYDQPGDNNAWALVDGFWQYTNQPTPGNPNLPMLTNSTEGSGSDTTSDLVPCRADQERNPDTNRCRLIQAAAASLVGCGPGQERNPATNRCRSLLTATNDLVPCKEGQERNPDTNRCRSIESTASALVPCAAGQERNPDTNRCRKSTGSGATGIAGVKDVASGSIGGSPKWLLAGLAVVAALGYAAYEWRQEFLTLLSKSKSRVTGLMTK